MLRFKTRYRNQRDGLSLCDSSPVFRFQLFLKGANLKSFKAGRQDICLLSGANALEVTMKHGRLWYAYFATSMLPEVFTVLGRCKVRLSYPPVMSLNADQASKT